MELATIRDWCQIIYYVAISVTGPVALFGFLHAKKREQQQREDGTYHSLDEKYLDYLKTCLQYPELDIADFQDQQPRDLNEIDKKRELLIFTMLISLLERAFLMYRGHTAKVRRKQWAGWEVYIEWYCSRENFRSAWKLAGDSFDVDFCRFMDEKIARTNAVS